MLGCPNLVDQPEWGITFLQICRTLAARYAVVGRYRFSPVRVQLRRSRAKGKHNANCWQNWLEPTTADMVTLASCLHYTYSELQAHSSPAADLSLFVFVLFLERLSGCQKKDCLRQKYQEYVGVWMCLSPCTAWHSLIIMLASFLFRDIPGFKEAHPP